MYGEAHPQHEVLIFVTKSYYSQANPSGCKVQREFPTGLLKAITIRFQG